MGNEESALGSGGVCALREREADRNIYAYTESDGTLLWDTAAKPQATYIRVEAGWRRSERWVGGGEGQEWAHERFSYRGSVGSLLVDRKTFRETGFSDWWSVDGAHQSSRDVRHSVPPLWFEHEKLTPRAGLFRSDPRRTLSVAENEGARFGVLKRVET